MQFFYSKKIAATLLVCLLSFILLDIDIDTEQSTNNPNKCMTEIQIMSNINDECYDYDFDDYFFNVPDSKTWRNIANQHQNFSLALTISGYDVRLEFPKVRITDDAASAINTHLLDYTIRSRGSFV